MHPLGNGPLALWAQLDSNVCVGIARGAGWAQALPVTLSFARASVDPVFAVGWALAMVLVNHRAGDKPQKSAAEIGTLALSSLLFFSLGQVQDIIIWGEPFAQLRAYIAYNSTHASGYPQGFWHQYVWVIRHSRPQRSVTPTPCQPRRRGTLRLRHPHLSAAHRRRTLSTRAGSTNRQLSHTRGEP